MGPQRNFIQLRPCLTGSNKIQNLTSMCPKSIKFNNFLIRSNLLRRKHHPVILNYLSYNRFAAMSGDTLRYQYSCNNTQVFSSAGFASENRIEIRLRDVAPLSGLLAEDVTPFPCSIGRCVNWLQISISPHIAGIGPAEHNKICSVNSRCKLTANRS